MAILLFLSYLWMKNQNLAEYNVIVLHNYIKTGTRRN